jgi:hypothetical protein
MHHSLDQVIGTVTGTIAIVAQAANTATTVHILELVIARGRHHLIETSTTVHILEIATAPGRHHLAEKTTTVNAPRSLDIAITRGYHYFA